MARQYRLSRQRRLVNVIMKTLARSPLAPPHAYVLRVPGRKSGRLYQTPVRLVEQGRSRWLVAPYGERAWVRNARAAGTVELQRGHRRARYAIRELAAEESGPILKRYAREVPVTRPFFDARPDDEAATFAAEAERHPVFALLPAAGDDEVARAV